MKDVKLGSTKCKFNEPNKVYEVWYDTWDYEEQCPKSCESSIRCNNWEKACCEADLSKPDKVCCKVHDNAEVVDVMEGDSGRKAVQCKGILKCFLYRILIII